MPANPTRVFSYFFSETKLITKISNNFLLFAKLLPSFNRISAILLKPSNLLCSERKAKTKQSLIPCYLININTTVSPPLSPLNTSFTDRSILSTNSKNLLRPVLPTPPSPSNHTPPSINTVSRLLPHPSNWSIPAFSDFNIHGHVDRLSNTQLLCNIREDGKTRISSKL